MVLGRMIWFYSPSRSLFGIPAPTIAAVFVSLDVITFVIQLIGGLSAGPASPADDQLRAVHIYMGGIGLQEFFIVIFLALVIKFQLTTRNAKANSSSLRVEENQAMGYSAPAGQKGSTILSATLYTTLALISVSISNSNKTGRLREH